MDHFLIYLVAFAGAMMIALVVTPGLIRLATVWHIVDQPSIRKMHARSMPRIGGTAFFLAIILVVPTILFFAKIIPTDSVEIWHKLIAIFSGATLMYIVGLVDDFRGVRARYKLIAQIIAAMIVCWAGVRIELLGAGKMLMMDMGWLSWPITIAWIVVLTNAVNLIDGLDGLAAGIAAITCAVLTIFSIYSGQVVMAILMIAMLGGLMGFLTFNFNPAKIFMGDCGTLFLGFFLASVSVFGATKSQTIVALALPVLSLGLPIFDAIFSIVRRFLERRPIFSADRSHIHHKLIDKGIRHRQAVLLMYVVTLLAGGVGLFMMIMNHIAAMTIFLSVCLMLVLVFRFAGAVQFRRMISQVQANWRASAATKDLNQKMARLQALIRRTKNTQQWWRCARLAAAMVGMAGLKATVNQDGKAAEFSWTTGKKGDGKSSEMSLQFNRGDNVVVGLKATLSASDSLETQGRKILLFGRMIDRGTDRQMEDDLVAQELGQLSPATEK